MVQLSHALVRHDLEELRRKVEQLERGDLSATAFRAFRVPQGIYEQRQSGTFMLRIRLVAGIVGADQMRAAADVSADLGDGTLHVTSRQDLQVHGVAAANLYPAMTRLADVGLSTKGGGGNTVRNIAACHYAGVCTEEAFDVTPHVARLTQSLVPDPLSYQLPRKFKIACSGCARDCAGAAIHDVGFIGRLRNGEDGFTVYVGGGMGAQSRVATVLEDFVPAARALQVADAVRKVFDKYGNRKNRHRARLRFLIEDLGFDVFEARYREELKRGSDLPEPKADRIVSRPVRHAGDAPPPLPGFHEWRQIAVTAQKQAGYHAVEIAAPLGVFQAEQMRQLASVVDRFGEGALRATNAQSFILRWVAEADLSALHAELSNAGWVDDAPPVLRHLVVCAGASTCRLGICLSRGLAMAVRKAVLGSDLNAGSGTGRVRIHISGCPNACGRHLLADIGLSGMARRVNGRPMPYYAIHLGGRWQEGEKTLAKGAGAIPARNIPPFIVDLLQSFERSEQAADFAAFLAGDGMTIAGELSRKHGEVSGSASDERDYIDWGAAEPFSLAGRGLAECGAGVFDLIQVDLASARAALDAGRLFSATASAARSLLVTCGEQADTDQEALALFQRHFVKSGLVAANFGPLIEHAQEAVAAAADPETVFSAREDDVADLVAAVNKVYEGLGPSLRVATNHTERS